jgi:hypothetical protein
MSTTDPLDEAVRAAAGTLVQSGEQIITWVVLCGTRNFNGDGGVIVMPAEVSMPVWQAKGILVDALDEIRNGGGRMVLPADGPPDDDLGGGPDDDFRIDPDDPLGGQWPAA